MLILDDLLKRSGSVAGNDLCPVIVPQNILQFVYPQMQRSYIAFQLFSRLRQTFTFVLQLLRSPIILRLTIRHNSLIFFYFLKTFLPIFRQFFLSNYSLHLIDQSRRFLTQSLSTLAACVNSCASFSI